MNGQTVSRILREMHDEPREETRRWLRRAQLQMEFARAFASALPAEETAGWAEAIDTAAARLETHEPDSGLAGLRKTVQAAEGQMEAIGRAAREYRIHCVGHGHIDMNWMWSWPETVATTHDTFASVLSLMEQFPELTYSQSQASVYALVERHFPAMFERIRERVKEGRWEVTAVHWVEGDKNLASGESLCRHLLYTRDYFRQRFGLAPEDLPVDWEPDTFGHAATIPTILAQAAVKYYYSCRTGGGFDHARVGGPRPRLFWWQGPDGSRVLVNRESTWYNSYVNIGDNIALPLVDFVRETGLHDWLNVFGIGNHGGGPTRTEVEYLSEMREWPIYPQVLFSTATRYFTAVEQEMARSGRELPVLAHELNFEFTGCYTSQSAIKRANRLGESYLAEAETLGALASRLADQPYPADLLREAWIGVLFNQFHDILPGSGVRETRAHAEGLFQEAGAVAGAIKRSAGGALAGRIDTLALLPNTPEGRHERALAEEGKANTPFVAGSGIGAMLSGYSQASGGGRRFRPFVVYNPCAWPRSERVTAALYDTDFRPGDIVALDEEGRAHPTQFLGKSSDWGHDKLSVAFDAQDVPALGYRTYLLCEGAPSGYESPLRLLPKEWIETPFLRFQLDRYRCGLIQLIDKRTGAHLALGSAPIGSWEYVTERPRGMTAWVLGRELEPPLTLTSTGFHVMGAERNQGTAVSLEQDAFGFRADWHLVVLGTQSTIRVSLLIHGLEPRLDFSAEVDWREIGDPQRGIPGLVLSFPFRLDSVMAQYEAPFGSVERDCFLQEEVPTLRYAHLGGQASAGGDSKVYAGVTLVQDCKYGHQLNFSELRLRILRSSFDPDHAPEVGKSTVRYSLYLHDKPPTPADLVRLGAAWNHPLMLIPTNLQRGDTPARDGFVQVSPDNVVLTCLKQALDGNGLILRLVELNGEATEAEVRLAPALAAGISSAERVDVLERPSGEAAWKGGVLRVPVPAHGFSTVRLA